MSNDQGGVSAMSAELGSLLDRLRTDVMWHRRRGNETIASDCQEAADMLEACRAVGVRQEQVIIDSERKIEQLRDALRWIPVAERLPDKNTEVLIAFAGQCSIPATGQYTGGAFDSHGWCYPAENRGSSNDGEDPVVTHWMALPEVPNALDQRTGRADHR